ncbi:hypothetical protein KKP04_03995 [Rhodomicrobium sp. Az07]|uniref:hypothetical protein n=1 Tax=Rhodomicrobium sp. Az07 TaxID=2839034 RepID=UPI001BE5CE8E|nr:hypothetical protein [Rhodomicrobium sp. Az07]MBT3070030.1 hypothetical protein [Rhodomicrobium sp. Az07]
MPARYAPVEERKVIWLSLHTDSESVARRKAAAYNRERYGKGGSLERLRETILAAAL